MAILVALNLKKIEILIYPECWQIITTQGTAYNQNMIIIKSDGLYCSVFPYSSHTVFLKTILFMTNAHMIWNISLSKACNSPTFYFLVGTEVTTKLIYVVNYTRPLPSCKNKITKSHYFFKKSSSLDYIYGFYKRAKTIYSHTHFYCFSIKSHHMIESTLTHVNTATTFVSLYAHHQYYYVMCSKKGSHALLRQLLEWKSL